jgi:Xaa-Pro aminopeptidase
VEEDGGRDRLIVLYGGENNPNVFYLTRFSSPDPVIVTDNRGLITLWVTDLEYENAKDQVKPGVVVRNLLREIDPILISGTHPTELASRRIAAIARWNGATSITADRDIPGITLDEVRSLGIDVFVSHGAYAYDRRFKTPDEIEQIARTQNAGLTALDAAINIIKSATVRQVSATSKILYYQGKPLSGDYLVSIIEDKLRTLGYATPKGTIVCGAPDNSKPHRRTTAVLEAGKPIVLDVFPQDKATKMWGDMTRTVVRGQPEPEVVRMYNAVLEAQTMALSMSRPGVTCADIHRAVCETFKRHGYASVYDGYRDIPSTARFIHGTGHGVGLDLHEDPRIGSGDTRKLVAGDVITIEPGLYDPRFGGVRIEDTIAITAGGYRQLTPYPKTLALDAV